MRICVVGPGALGCLFAALLARAGHQVVLVDHHRERAERIDVQGIGLYDQQGLCVVPVQVTAVPAAIGLVPLIFLCVKSEDVAEATRTILPALAPESLLVALQNGIAHHPILTELLHASWALGVTAQGATLLGPGQVRHGGDGPTILGFLGEVDNAAHGRLQAATDLLCRAGIATTVSHDIRAAAWNKLIVNAGINALTAIENCANGELLNRPAALATLKAAVLEAAKVAKACGIQVNPDPVSMTVSVCLQTRNNISSMLQDIRQGRQTEVEAINGAILRQAQTLGIPAPVNQALLLGVKGLERKGDEQP